MTTNRILLDTSGAPGLEGSDGSDGYRDGENGTDGTHGKKGQDAKNIKLSLSADEINQQVIVNANSRSYQLPLGNPEAAIFLKANGGKGGDGGDGGRGKKGYDGRSGSDATESSSGEDGTDGGPGGNGGDAGNGANGGNGGIIDISVDGRDMDLLMLLKKVEACAGPAGRGGDGGRYGAGGSGGSGGSSHSWTETVYSTNMDPEGTLQMDTSYVSHSNPGGRDGRSGWDGQSGSSGNNGYQGQQGAIRFNVKNMGTYSDFYDLSLEELKISSENGIFEPGEVVQVNKIVLKNSGKMPTPSHQEIHVSLVNNQWVSFDEKNNRKISIPIAPSKNYILEEPFFFTLQENNSPPVANTLYQRRGELRVNATLERVNHHFPEVVEEAREFAIRYPVEISSIAMPRSIARDEKAPFVIQIKNVSTKPLGLKATEPRLLEVTISLPSMLKNIWAAFLDDKKEMEVTPTSLTFPVSTLLPGETKDFVGTLQFVDDAPVRTETEWNVQLQLGKINNPDVKHTIAKRTSSLQLSESYRYNPEADFVLVTNNRVQKDVVEQWQDIAMKFGTSLSLWDTTLYSGLSYTKKRKDGRSLIDDMKDKVIIILNYPNKDDKCYPTDYLDAMEIFTAAKDANISTYVIGNNFDLQKSILPLSHKEQKNISLMREFYGTPTLSDLQKEITKQQSDLKKHHPDRRFVLYEEFNPSITNKNFSTFKKSWKIGDMVFAESLGRKDAHIAFREMEKINSPDVIDFYQIIKLLPFSKKLLYIDRYSAPIHKEAIRKAIMSDLTDELSSCREQKWQDKENQSEFDLQYFHEFAKHDFKDKESFLELLVQYEYLVDRVKSTWDFHAKYHRRKELYQICHQQVADLFNAHFKSKEFLLKKNIMRTVFYNTHRKQVYAHFSFPYGKDPQMDSNTLLDSSLFKNELSKYHPRNSLFKDNFSTCDTETGFNQSIDAYKKDCRFPLK